MAVTDRFYAELRQIAERVFARERGGHTLQPTAVVNEACMRLISGSARLPDVPREQRLALAGRILKQVLVDHARARGAAKRGGDLVRESAEATGVLLELDGAALDDRDLPTQVDFSHVHDALERLRELDERQAEVVTLRIFSGLTMQQIAAVMGVSKRTAEAAWTVARAWLRRELAAAMHPAGPRTETSA